MLLDEAMVFRAAGWCDDDGRKRKPGTQFTLTTTKKKTMTPESSHLAAALKRMTQQPVMDR